MRRVLPFVLLVGLAGCSNAPLAGLMDCVSPARSDPRPVRPEPARPPDGRPARPPRGDLPPDDFLPPVGPR